MPEIKKTHWAYRFFPILILLGLILFAGLYTLKKLNYSINDVISILSSKAQQKLNINLGPIYQPKLNFPKSIYQWQGQGANPTYNTIVTRYDRQGRPISLPQHPQITRIKKQITVTNTQQLIHAIRKAQPGDAIELQSGIYSINHNISISKNGTKELPIILYAKQLGDVLIEFDAVEGFKHNAAYWTFQNLLIKGDCASHNKCEHAFHITGKADGAILRNNIIMDFNAAIKVNGIKNKEHIYDYADNLLIEKNSFTNSTIRETGSPVTTIDVVGGDNLVIKANLIADFIKLGSNKVSYAAFLKGYGKNGVFEDNLVICNMNLYKKGHTQVGLSFGGGGTGTRFCWDKQCQYEHDTGTLKNNIIMNCNDVGIYINKGKDITIINNKLYNTAGIDVRFVESSAIVNHNQLDGKIRSRNFAKLSQQDNTKLEQAPKLEKFGKKLTIHFDEKAHQIIKKQKRLKQLQAKEKKLKSSITLCNNPYQCQYTDLNKALKALKTKGTLYLEPGIYETCGYIRRSVKLIGISSKNQTAHLKTKACNGKAALIINAPDVRIENIEISKIRVKDQNGACFRIEQKASNLYLNNINCHDSQAGIIANISKGNLIINNSIFERNGYNHGKVHNVSINSNAEVNISHSKILSTKGKGNSFNINAPIIKINQSIIAALNGKNSRAISNTHGGNLTITNSIIQQGPNSDNSEMIAFSLAEINSAYISQSIHIENSYLIFDRKSGLPFFGKKNKLFRTSNPINFSLINNTIIAMDAWGVDIDKKQQQNNQIFNNRKDAQLSVYNGKIDSLNF